MECAVSSARIDSTRSFLRDSAKPMWTRREFLKVGASGTLLLAAARLGHGQSGSGRVSAARTGAGLDADAREVLAAVVPVMLAGALPEDRSVRAGRIAATIDGVDRAVAGLPHYAQSDLGSLFALLSFAPSRWLLAGVRQPWRAAPGEEVARFLERWRASGWALKQQAYQAFHELVFAAYYADPASWPDIGYPGPPRLP
jgi:hypothetical protein